MSLSHFESIFMYDVGESSFASNNGGAIPSNVIIASNTSSNDNYIKCCKDI